MAIFSDKEQYRLKAYYFQSSRGLPKATTLYNDHSLQQLWDKNTFVQANTKKNSAANGYSNLLPNGTGVISVIWTQTLQILKVRQKTVIINKSITSLLLSSTGCWTIFHSLFLQMEASIQ